NQAYAHGKRSALQDGGPLVVTNLWKRSDSASRTGCCLALLFGLPASPLLAGVVPRLLGTVEMVLSAPIEQVLLHVRGMRLGRTKRRFGRHDKVGQSSARQVVTRHVGCSCVVGEH